MSLFWEVGMVNYPYSTNFTGFVFPANPIYEFCTRFNHDFDSDNNLVSSFSNALQVLTNFTGNENCLSLKSKSPVDHRAWHFQRCSELVFADCSNGTSDSELFLKYDWSFQEYSDDCYSEVKVRPQKNLINENYGLSFEYGSNIIFSNGLLDPWSGYGILNLINDKHEIVIIPDSAHHLDLRSDHPNDPQSVRNARNFHLTKFKSWIRDFYRSKKWSE